MSALFVTAFCCGVVLQALREVDPPSFQQLFSRKDVQVRGECTNNM
jgi:hypothetical protein